MHIKELCLHTNSQWEQRPQNSEQVVPILANWNTKFLFNLWMRLRNERVIAVGANVGWYFIIIIIIQKWLTNLKCIWQIFFYLLDRIFMLFSYENRRNKFPINFSSPLLRPTNTWNFTSGSIQNRAWRESGDSGLWRQYRTAIFTDFSLAQCFSFAKGENMVQRCVAFGCSNTKDEIKGISIHQIPFYGDIRSEAAEKERKVDFIREWKSKALDSQQVFSRFARRISHQKISFAR